MGIFAVRAPAGTGKALSVFEYIAARQTSGGVNFKLIALCRQ